MLTIIFENMEIFLIYNFLKSIIRDIKFFNILRIFFAHENVQFLIDVFLKLVSFYFMHHDFRNTPFTLHQSVMDDETNFMVTTPSVSK